jgi:UDP-glucose 4-epimerase
MKVFLTGGSGFIGSWVLKTLLSQDHDVTILVRNLDKVPSLHKLPNVTIVQGQLLDWDTIDKAMVGQDACVHVALGWGDTPVEMLKNDTLATVFLLEQAEKHNLRHFLYTSSTAAIGEVREFMKEDVQTRPVDLYGATKAASEAFILGYSEKAKGLHCNIIRPGYTFGNPAFADSSTQPDKRFF